MENKIGRFKTLSFAIGFVLFAMTFTYTALGESENPSSNSDPKYRPTYQPYLKSEGTLGNIILDSHKEQMKKAKVKPVVFPHWFHRIRFKCKICHEEIFVMEKGANAITMGTIINGEFCGVCHDGYIAFAPVECDRCHSYEPAP